MMIVNVSEVALKDIEEALGEMKNKAPVLLKKSVNETAKKMLKDVRNDVRKRYIVKVNDVNSQINIQGKTSAKSPYVKIVTKGEQFELIDFDVSPKTYNPKRKMLIKARQMHSGSKKELKGGKETGTPFVIKFKSGHLSVAQRAFKGPKSPNTTRLGDRYVKKMTGSSMRTMVNKVWEKNQADYSQRLKNTVQKHMEELINGGVT